MNKEELKKIAETRINEAKLLLNNEKYDGAYYLAGYSIECAIKVCISNKFNNNEIPDKKFVLDIYTHDLNKLIKLADLEDERKAEEKQNEDFEINWAIVKDWSENSRYKFFTKSKANELINSVISEQGGVLKWIQKYW